MSQTPPTKKITSFDGIVIGAGATFTSGTFKGSNNNLITLPTVAETLATIGGTETLTNKTLTAPTIATITNSAATLTLPSTTGTLALVSEVNAQKDRIDRLLDYLEGWIGVGNINMNDIKNEVDPAE